MDTVVLNATPIATTSLRVTAEDGRAAPIAPGQLSACLLVPGGTELRWYAPQHRPGAVDPQTPHDRDELYFVVSGTAVFIRAEAGTPFGDDPGLLPHAEERVAVQPGDVLSVPAGTPHHFEAASPDFGTWMVFHGPEGGGH